MPKKNFKNNVKGADRLFSANDADVDTQDTLNVQNISSVQDTLHVQSVQDRIATQYVRDMSSVQNTQDMLHVQSVQDIPKKRGYYRLNLKLDMELKDYISDAAWQRKMNVTEYLSTLIRADMESQIQRGIDQ